MTDRAEALAIYAQIESAQAALRKMLQGAELSRLVERPASGEWSAMENVRHLVFAEQHHFAPHLPKGFRWTSAGVPPPSKEKGERRLTPVGRDPATPVDEVFDAWAKVHAVVRELCIEADDTLASRLEGNLKHVEIHTRTIERLLEE